MVDSDMVCLQDAVTHAFIGFIVTPKSAGCNIFIFIVIAISLYIMFWACRSFHFLKTVISYFPSCLPSDIQYIHILSFLHLHVDIILLNTYIPLLFDVILSFTACLLSPPIYVNVIWLSLHRLLAFNDSYFPASFCLLAFYLFGSGQPYAHSLLHYLFLHNASCITTSIFIFRHCQPGYFLLY